MAFRSSSSNATAANPCVVTAAAGIQNNDSLILCAASDSATCTYTWPSGFTAIGAAQTSSLDGMSMHAALKKAASESGNYTITPSAGNIIGGMLVFSGEDTTNFNHRNGFGASSAGNASPWKIFPGTFTAGVTSAACDIAAIYSSDEFLSQAVTHTPQSGYTQAFDINSTAMHLAASYKEAQASGFAGGLTATGTSGGDQAGWGIIVQALQNAGGGGGGGSFRNFYADSSPFYGAQYAPMSPVERFLHDRRAVLQHYLQRVTQRAS